MKEFNLDDAIRKVKDFPKEGILFYDITSILTNPAAFSFCIDRMVELYKDENFDAVAAAEARGFLFAAPFCERLGIPLILIRKKGKLPGDTLTKTYALEYGEDSIQIHKADVPVGGKVLLVDDLIATGGTLKAAAELLEEGGATVPAAFGVVGLPFLAYDKVLSGLKIDTLINYDSE
ncbi:MAG: adenine phosphoribosyltransferase [Spirochaetales bacterium]|uniref:Adenine phosphoribosyltransferase n=1 Tax=Candidatus Thalassospirochaeta sargassi TaxID=3119039 RepID=A0AAJ1MLY2_9SPIO|nr:adenine phosphoribosyltransferase [Spirochaetales bacterium]